MPVPFKVSVQSSFVLLQNTLSQVIQVNSVKFILQGKGDYQKFVNKVSLKYYATTTKLWKYM